MLRGDSSAPACQISHGQYKIVMLKVVSVPPLLVLVSFQEIKVRKVRVFSTVSTDQPLTCSKTDQRYRFRWEMVRYGSAILVLEHICLSSARHVLVPPGNMVRLFLDLGIVQARTWQPLILLYIDVLEERANKIIFALVSYNLIFF